MTKPPLRRGTIKYSATREPSESSQVARRGRPNGDGQVKSYIEGCAGDDMRHKWFKIERSAHEVCTRCGLVKNGRRDRNFHWTEYKKMDGKWFTSDRTPLCEQPKARQVRENDVT